MSSNQPAIGFRPDILLRAEAAASLIATCYVYGATYPGHWGMFALLFFTPDLALLPYVKGPSRLAAACYNFAHNYVPAVALGAAAIPVSSQWMGMLALIWMAHISFDRLFGYGLKFAETFKTTHIQNAAKLC